MLSKAPLPSVGGVTLFIVMPVNAVHPANALPPMLVTLDGIFRLVRLVHNVNAPLPIVCKLFDNDKPVMFEHPKNALSPDIEVTPLGITSVPLNPVQALNA